jgi:hypothetical protein
VDTGLCAGHALPDWVRVIVTCYRYLATLYGFDIVFDNPPDAMHGLRVHNYNTDHA